MAFSGMCRWKAYGFCRLRSKQSIYFVRVCLKQGIQLCVSESVSLS